MSSARGEVDDRAFLVSEDFQEALGDEKGAAAIDFLCCVNDNFFFSEERL